MPSVRTRIAPSPTGPLHIGNARTALFNWLYARQHGGVFVVRVEDTDVARSEPQWERDALKNFSWLGLDWDEGPMKPTGFHWAVSAPTEPNDEKGDYGPYRQSARKGLYRKYLEELLEEGQAYYCFCTAEELEAMRQTQLARNEAPRYIGRCRELSAAEVGERRGRGEPAVLRFKTPAKQIIVDDIVRGKVEFDTALSGDIVIAKNLDYALYNFAVVVDDFTMEISHVIRGEDHLSNTPKQILLQEALGFPRPRYAHIPLLLGTDRAKLSKRHGATALTEYRQAGYLPEAAMNFLALLGWNPGGHDEIFSKTELLERFSLERVQKSAAMFNVGKLQWLNGAYIRKMSAQELCERYAAFREHELRITDKHFLAAAVATVHMRARTLSEITDLISFYIEAPEPSKAMLGWKDMNDDQVKRSLEYAYQLLKDIAPEDFTEKALERLLLEKAAAGVGESPMMALAGDVALLEGKTGQSKPTGENIDRGWLLWPLRVALSGRQSSPSPFEIAAVLGKEETLKRLERAIKIFPTNEQPETSKRAN